MHKKPEIKRANLEEMDPEFLSTIQGTCGSRCLLLNVETERVCGRMKMREVE